MTSDARIAANRRNAAKSTGPRTEEGKEAAAQNALRHGLTARRMVTARETEADFATFAASMRAALAPEDEVEETLAERVIFYAWRLQRTALAERGVLDGAGNTAMGERVLMAYETPMSRVLYNRPEELIALSRYEAGLDRGFSRALALLERRQARRRDDAVGTPVAVIIDDGATASVDEIAKPFDHKAGIENCETKPRPPEGGADVPPDAALEMPPIPPENAAKCTGGAA